MASTTVIILQMQLHDTCVDLVVGLYKILQRFRAAQLLKRGERWVLKNVLNAETSRNFEFPPLAHGLKVMAIDEMCESYIYTPSWPQTKYCKRNTGTRTT